MIAVESLLAAAGWCLFGLGFICLFVPRHFRYGVCLMLTGDVFFALNLAFIKKTLAVMRSLGLEPDTWPQQLTAGGIVLAVLLAAVWLVLFVKLWHLRPLWVKKSPAQAQAKADAASAGEAAEGQVRQTADPAVFSQVLSGRREDR